MATPRFVLDRTGFPMIWSEAARLYLHWLPVTKIQFEVYLCDALPVSFDAPAYDECLTLNSRVSHHHVTATNYWGAFITGVRPDDVQSYASWSGALYALPTQAEWFAAYQEARALPTVAFTELARLGLAPRVAALLERVEAAAPHAPSSSRSLADQMFMRYGVMEWIKCTGKGETWGAFGQPSVKFYSMLYRPDAGRPSLPTDVGRRLPAHGFRLVRRVA